MRTLPIFLNSPDLMAASIRCSFISSRPASNTDPLGQSPLVCGLANASAEVSIRTIRRKMSTTERIMNPNLFGFPLIYPQPAYKRLSDGGKVTRCDVLDNILAEKVSV